MFTAKLKTKFCWTGSTKGKGKIAFQNFEEIIGVLRIAVSAHIDCTIADIEEECKLRFKQAQKDYDREKEKKLLERQALERQELKGEAMERGEMETETVEY